MSLRNRNFGGTRKRKSIRRRVFLDKRSLRLGNRRERRLHILHLHKCSLMLEGTYSPEIPHVVTRRRSSANQVITLRREVPSGVSNLQPVVVA